MGTHVPLSSRFCPSGHGHVKIHSVGETQPLGSHFSVHGSMQTCSVPSASHIIGHLETHVPSEVLLVPLGQEHCHSHFLGDKHPCELHSSEQGSMHLGFSPAGQWEMQSFFSTHVPFRRTKPCLQKQCFLHVNFFLHK